MNDEQNNTQAALDAGMMIGDPKSLAHHMSADGIPYAVLRQDMKLESLEKFFLNPVRKRAVATFAELPSFARYLEAHATFATVIFATVSQAHARFGAIIDYHAPGAEGAAGWREHQATFAPQLSEEFARWQVRDKQWFGQVEFAQFLQDATVDVVRPPGAELLEIAKELVAKKSYDFRSAQNLRDGTVQFHYVEDMTTSGGQKGTLEVPETFTLEIPIHKAGARYVIEARLKFKIEDQRLKFQYELLRLPQVFDHVHNELIKAVKTATKIEPLMGSVS
jgi:uncharacterized protein YfdQ (DUF2303 family)